MGADTVRVVCIFIPGVRYGSTVDAKTILNDPLPLHVAEETAGKTPDVQPVDIPEDAPIEALARISRMTELVMLVAPLATVITARG